MDDLLLSYIVPVYNTGQWLETCLLSISDYMFDSCEIIVVDDGSTDNSAQIIKEIEKNDNRVKYVYQFNQGLSAARNAGLRIARGKYVLFIDSDDIVVVQNVLYMLKKAIDENADIIIGRIVCFDDKGSFQEWGEYINNAVFPDGVSYLKAIYENATYAPMAFGYMVKRELITQYKLEFKVGIIHEDELWTPTLLLRAKKTITIDECHYLYRTQRNGSITSSSNGFNKIYSLSVVICELIDDYLRCLTSSEKAIVALSFIRWRIKVLYSICAHIDIISEGQFRILKDLSFGYLSYFNHETKGYQQ